jgi:hypothetical protein
MPRFRDPRVGLLNRLALNDARLIVHQEALRRGALTSTELASRSGPTEIVRVTICSPLWAAPVASVYFRGEDDAREWAADVLARLPRLDRAAPSASSRAWRLEVTAANVTRASTTASLSRWRAVGGPVLAILEADGAALGACQPTEKCQHMRPTRTSRID